MLFDGVCNLCNGFVQFVIAHDRRGEFRFASLQSAAAGRLLTGAPSRSLSRPDSVVLLEDGRVYTESSAILRVTRRMSGLWPLFYGFVLVPRPVRDGVYRWVARNRYRWFGRRDSCMVPTPALRARFLED